MTKRDRLKQGSCITIQSVPYKILATNIAYLEKENGESFIDYWSGDKKGQCMSIKTAEKSNLIKKDPKTPIDSFSERCTSATSPTTENSIVAPPSPDSNTYFLQARDLRVQSYLGKGLILPPHYDSAKNISGDILSQFPDQLVLYKNPPPPKKAQLIVSVWLFQDEIDQYFQDAETDFILFPRPLPVSRITSIEAPPETVPPKQYAAGWVSPDLPVPVHLFKTVPQGAEKRVPVNVPPATGTSRQDFSENITHFNRSLGLMAFIRNTEFYFASKLKVYKELPNEFNLLMDNLFKGFNQGEGCCPILLKLLGLKIFYKKKLKDVPLSSGEAALIKLLESNKNNFTDKNAVKEIVKKIIEEHCYNQKIGGAFNDLIRNPDNYRNAVKTLRGNQIKDSARITAVLYKFAQREARGDRIVKQRLAEDWLSAEQAIPILGTLGAYYGYKKIDAREDPNIVPPWLNHSLPDNRDIKFHLRNPWERELTEAIYQYIFKKDQQNPNFQKVMKDIHNSPEQQNRSSDECVSITEKINHNIGVKEDQSTFFNRFISELKKNSSGFIDEGSETGKYLFKMCFLEAGTQRFHKGQSSLKFRRSHEDLIDLVKKNKNEINWTVLLTAIKEDTQSTGA